VNSDFVLQKLNNYLHNLNFLFSQSRFESTLTIDNFLPIFFDNGADRTITNRCFDWLKVKHKNNSIHEPATIAALLFCQTHFSQQIKVIFDIGALYGYFSLISKTVFSQATIFGFEMNPQSYIILCKNINVNKHLGIPAVQAINMGLSDRTSFQEKVFVTGFILRENSENSESERLFQLDIMSLDDFCRISNFQPQLIKIDVEGYQAKIFPGGMATIEKAKPIIILEFDDPKTLAPFNTTNKQITKPLFDLGYNCYWCKNQRQFQGEFKKLEYDTFSEEHETNSLGVFLPH
jgi:FkbM family methyltransferase